MYQIDFHKPLHIHFIGIGGISMSGLAEILLGRKFPDFRFRCQIQPADPAHWKSVALRSITDSALPTSRMT